MRNQRDDDFPVKDAAAGENLAEVLPQDDEMTIGQERVMELISYVVVNLVDKPQEVKVDLVRKQDREVYQVKVSQEDLGKVIGKGGQTARALRILVTAATSQDEQRIGLEIVE